MTRNLTRQLWILLSAWVIGFYAMVINRFRAVGLDHIPNLRGRGILLAANHTSAYDTVFLPSAVIWRFPNRMIWAPAKQELFRNRFLAWLIGSWGAFPVKRGRDLRALRRLAKLLASETVMLFPEGTRRYDGQLGRGNRAVGKLIFDARPVVVPAALSGLNAWHFPGYGQQAQVVFGPPVDLADLYRSKSGKETHTLIVDRVMAAIAELLEADSQP